MRLLISTITTAPLLGAFFVNMTTQNQITASKKVALTLTLPTINFSALAVKTKVLLSNIYRPLSQNASKTVSEASSKARSFKLPNLKDKFKFNKRSIKFIFPAVIGIVIIISIVSIVRSFPDAQSRPVNDSKDVSQNALTTINLDRKFAFPLKDENGKEVGKFDYIIQTSQLQSQIIVKGQRATAIDGKVFLILNLKITNNLEQTIQLNTRDYLRFIVKSNENEQLAPDIHNDPVEVQAISTKYTRVGITIDEVDAKKLIQLKVGEIGGEKQNIDLNFKY